MLVIFQLYLLIALVFEKLGFFEVGHELLHILLLHIDEVDDDEFVFKIDDRTLLGGY